MVLFWLCVLRLCALLCIGCLGAVFVITVCASFVIYSALLSGVFCCVLLYSCVRFCLTNVVVCLVCALFV